MIHEREREALMRLTMCAREECGMCKYKDTCDFDFQYELTTKNMNILAEALRKTEPTISKMEQVDKDINVRSKDEPQTCDTCKHKGEYAYCRLCGRLSENNYEPKDEPQTDCAWSKCDD